MRQEFLLIFLNLLFILSFLFIKKIKYLNYFGIISWIFLFFFWILRFINAKHLPFFGAYESSISILFFTGIVLLFYFIFKKIPAFYLFPILSIFFLFHSSFFSNKIWATTISERSFWVYLHSIFAYLSFGFNFFLFSLSFLKILKKELKENLMNNLIVFYSFYTFMLILGFFYRFILFGKIISFDPMEAMHISIFLIYTTLIHWAYFKKIEEIRVAKIIFILFFLFVLSYRIILIFPPFSTYHIIDIELRMHIKP